MWPDLPYPDVSGMYLAFIFGFALATVLVGGVCVIWFWGRRDHSVPNTYQLQAQAQRLFERNRHLPLTEEQNRWSRKQAIRQMEQECGPGVEWTEARFDQVLESYRDKSRLMFAHYEEDHH